MRLLDVMATDVTVTSSDKTVDAAAQIVADRAGAASRAARLALT